MRFLAIVGFIEDATEINVTKVCFFDDNKAIFQATFIITISQNLKKIKGIIYSTDLSETTKFLLFFLFFWFFEVSFYLNLNQKM